MHFGFVDFDIALKAIGAVSSILVLLGLVAAIVRYYWKREDKADTKISLEEWRERANVRAAKIAELEKDKAELMAAVAEAKQMYQECEAHRAVDAQKMLRLYGRLDNYEKCINRLEAHAGFELTNFDDPFMHDTDTGDRGQS